MLVTIDGAHGNVPAFYRELQVKAACLKLKVDRISRQSAEMLDLIVHKGNGWLRHGTLDYHVRIRHSALGITLSDTSVHNMNVHMSWPRARVKCIRKRCSTIHAGNVAVTEFIDKMTNHCLSHVALKSLGSSLGSHSSPRKVSSWLVLPFHPL